ncbi:MAG: tryptophan synthase subunit alpha [Balneolales bacterium]
MQSDNRIARLFSNRNSDQKVMSLFLTAGYPSPDKTVELVLELEHSGADLIELGMPFSDPLADGPTIQYASKVAIEQGIHPDIIFDMVRNIRNKSDIPIILMGYINPVLHYGVEAFFDQAAKAGVDGIILPDVPPGEYPLIEKLCTDNRIAPIYLVAPNTPDERMQAIDRASKGFVYCVSVTGVTGARDGSEVSRSVQNFIQRVKKNVTHNPVLIGFGISSHQNAVQISREVDGFIVGSALIDYIRTVYPRKDWIQKTGAFVKQLKTGEVATIITK